MKDAIRCALERLARSRMRPPLGELNREAEIMTRDPDVLLSRIRVPSASMGSATEERRRPRGAFPEAWGLGEDSLRVLYSIVRRARPVLSVETGIANGESSRVILSAIRENGTGALVSYDPSENTGDAVSIDLRASWVRIREKMERDFPDTIDLFLHDSDHSYANMRREFEVARNAMTNGGWLLSDDVDSNYAFIDVCREIGRRPALLVEDRKVFGVLRVR